MEHKILNMIHDSRFKIREAGFSIIEMLVTFLVFSVIAVSVSAVFVHLINLQRRAFAIQKIQENSLFILESMSRDIRISRITDQESLGCTLTNINMTHPTKGAVSYRLANGTVEKSEYGGAFVAVSGNSVNFTRLNFCVKGSGINDDQTPRVAILTSVQNRTGKDIFQVNLQTSVASRDLTDEF